MSDIELNELPKSKEFMKHAKIADALTKKTELEHGFIFCKPKDKIIVDKLCIGNKCDIDISSEECSKNDNSFHTHPNRKLSQYSYDDVVHALKIVYDNKQPHIMCVSGDKSDYIRCDKIDTSAITPGTINLSYLTADDNVSVDNMLFLMNSNFMEFNKKTKEIEAKGDKHSIYINSMRRFIKEQKKLGIE